LPSLVGVLGDIGGPQLIRRAAGELAVHQVGGGWGLVHGPFAFVAGQALDAGAAHQQLHRAVPDHHAAAQGEFGVDSPAAVDTVGGGVDLADHVGQPGVADRPRRRCSSTPGVEPGLGDTDDSAGELEGQAFSGHRLDGRVADFWAHRLLQQLCGPAGDGQLGFQLGDPPSCRHQLCVVACGQAGVVAGVDEVLPAPVVGGLVADLQIRRDLGDGTAGGEQVQDLTTELWRVALCGNLR
jgi:hypothetical protein